MNHNLKSQYLKSQRGSAIIWILIAVGLFAALNFAFNSGNRSSASMMTDEQAVTYANQMIAYGNDVKAAVKRLQLRGCEDTEISFENNMVTGYTNANAPSSKKCHVFDPNGGGLNFNSPDTRITANNWVIVTGNTVSELGTAAASADILLTLSDIPENLCNKLNDQLNHNFSTNPPPDDGTWDGTTQFIGDFTVTDTVGANTPGLEGQSAACFVDDTPSNVFYQAIIIN